MAYKTSKKHKGLLLRESAPRYSAIGPPKAEKFGTFSDSKRAPIHRWFQYPAGFSYKAVEYILDLHGIRSEDVVYDPFTGTGTTNVVCKFHGLESIGVEAHPFVQKIAQVKTTWNYDFKQMKQFIDDFIFELNFSASSPINLEKVPALVRKCYSDINLSRLLTIKEKISLIPDFKVRNLFYLALTATLRRSSAAATGWPYIAPKKKILEKDGIKCFTEQINEMYNDLMNLPDNIRKTKCSIILGDARHSPIESNSIDLSFTSPPYLNNYDYADRTRLEVYFNGLASTWAEISESIRKKLIISATTQINRSNFDLENLLDCQIQTFAPKVFKLLNNKVEELKIVRTSKGGKKSYDIMVGQYFNDMTFALLDNFRVLKPGACFVLILGDSAPYGVYIPAEEILGEIALGIGFKDYSVCKLRERGNKWKGNPQRHHVLLKESILTLRK